MTSLQEFIKEIKKLKPIPAVADQLITVVDDPNSSMKDIANVIQYDPVITANVLKFCNSAFFGLKNKVESINDAVNLLGIDQIVELAFMKSCTAGLSGNQKGYGLEPGELWRYSVSSAIIAKQVAIKLSLKNKNTIFTSALIKDIGKIILEKHVFRSLTKIQNLVKNDNLSFMEAEKKILGINHAELGAMIARTWNFSPKMVKIIRYHHLADVTMIKDKEIAVVYLSDCICMMMGIGVGLDGLAYRFNDEVMKEFGLSADDISMIIADFGINMQKIEKLLHIV